MSDAGPPRPQPLALNLLHRQDRNRNGVVLRPRALSRSDHAPLIRSPLGQSCWNQESDSALNSSPSSLTTQPSEHYSLSSGWPPDRERDATEAWESQRLPKGARIGHGQDEEPAKRSIRELSETAEPDCDQKVCYHDRQRLPPVGAQRKDGQGPHFDTKPTLSRDRVFAGQYNISTQPPHSTPIIASRQLSSQPPPLLCMEPDPWRVRGPPRS